MKVYKLINSIIHLTWLGVVVMILIMGTTLFTSFTHKEPKKEVLIDTVAATPISENLAIGKALFKNNCASCHNKNMKDDLTGPALGGVTERWSAFPESDLYDWIRNSAKLINNKHPRALEIAKKYPGDMSSFVHLTDEEIGAILEYIEK